MTLGILLSSSLVDENKFLKVARNLLLTPLVLRENNSSAYMATQEVTTLTLIFLKKDKREIMCMFSTF